MPFYISSQIPDFEITSTRKEEHCWISRNGTTIFRCDLNIVNNSARVRDMRNIIEQDMVNHGLSYAKYFFSQTFSGFDFEVVYCGLDGRNMSEDTFSSGFLTTKWTKQLSRVKDTLHFFTKQGELPQMRQTVVIRRSDGTLQVYHTPEVSAGESAAGVYSVSVDPSLYKDWGKVLSITTYVGDRCFTHYYVDSQPGLTLLYTNPFNVLELVQIQGCEKRTLDIDQAEAVIDRKICYYDRTYKDLHEFISAPLDYDTAWHLNEVYASPLVYLVDNDYEFIDDLDEIIFADSTIEATSEKGKMSKVKLKWRYPNDKIHHRFPVSKERVFTEEFTIPFS